MITRVQVATLACVRLAMRAVLVAALVVQGLDSVAHAAAEEKEIEVYRVDKRVSDFPAQDDFSSPESAYATINHRYVDCREAKWPRKSTTRSVN